jgi:hypothetical protein
MITAESSEWAFAPEKWCRLIAFARRQIGLAGSRTTFSFFVIFRLGLNIANPLYSPRHADHGMGFVCLNTFC